MLIARAKFLFALVQGVAIVLLSGSPARASEPMAPVVCEPHQVTTQFVAARRTAPGEIAVDVTYQHDSNFPYQLNAAGGVALIDSARQPEQGCIKYKQTYRFFKRVNVSTINFTHRFRVWQGSKLLGVCDFEAKGVSLK
jgi:hypothetical protein